jgi:hypothetical protein
MYNQPTSPSAASNLFQLPDDVIICVFEFLPVCDLGTLAQVSKHISALSARDRIWVSRLGENDLSTLEANLPRNVHDKDRDNYWKSVYRQMTRFMVEPSFDLEREYLLQGHTGQVRPPSHPSPTMTAAHFRSVDSSKRVLACPLHYVTDTSIFCSCFFFFNESSFAGHLYGGH